MQCRTLKVVVGWGRMAEQKSSVGRTRMYDRVRYGRMPYEKVRYARMVAEESRLGRGRRLLDSILHFSSLLYC